MKQTLVVLLALISGCSYITPADVELAKQYCAPYGGWYSIQSTGAVMCNKPNVRSNHGSMVRNHVSWDTARTVLWKRENMGTRSEP